MTKRVFVVEDEPAFISLYEELFRLHGLEFAGYATDGVEAIRKMATGVDPDIVLIDHRLPLKDGISTMKELLSADGSLPIVFVSADISVRKEALANGARTFLLKPFSKAELFDAIDRHARSS